MVQLVDVDGHVYGGEQGQWGYEEDEDSQKLFQPHILVPFLHFFQNITGCKTSPI